MAHPLFVQTPKGRGIKKVKSEIFGFLRRHWLLIGILFLAAFLRLYRISDYMTFLGDEGRDVLVIKQMLVDHKFTLLGPTASVGGFFLGPIYYYFMIPFLWLWRFDPAGPAVMVALFGVATVYLVYLVAKEFFNQKAGVFAATLYAFSPMTIAYSRSSWNPNLMPFFSLLALFMIYRGVEKKSNRFVFLSGLFLGIALQLHYLATFLAVIMIVYLTISNFSSLKSLIKYYLVLFSGFLLGFALFLAFEIRHGFPNTQSIFRFIFGTGKDTGFVGGSVFTQTNDLTFRLFWRLLTSFPPIDQINFLKSTNLQLWHWGIILLIFTTLGFFLFNWSKALRQHSKELPKFNLLVLWLVLGVGLFSFYKKPIYDYYLGFMFPLPFLLVGSLLSNFKGFLRPFGVLIFATLLGGMLLGVPFRYTPNRQLAQTEEIARFVYDKTENKPFNFALVAGQNSDHAYRYFLEVWGAKPVTIENSQADPERKTVTDQLLIICENQGCQPLGNSLWEIAGFGRAEIAGSWDVSLVKVYKLVHYKGK